MRCCSCSSDPARPASRRRSTDCAGGCRALAIHDFDEIGVPSGADASWRRHEGEAWVRRALGYQAEGIDLLLAGQTPFGELLATPSAALLEAISGCLIDCDDETRLARLRRRGPEWLARSAGDLQDYLNWADWMRRHARDPRWRPEVIVPGRWRGTGCAGSAGATGEPETRGGACTSSTLPAARSSSLSTRSRCGSTRSERASGTGHIRSSTGPAATQPVASCPACVPRARRSGASPRSRRAPRRGRGGARPRHRPRALAARPPRRSRRACGVAPRRGDRRRLRGRPLARGGAGGAAARPRARPGSRRPARRRGECWPATAPTRGGSTRTPCVSAAASALGRLPGLGVCQGASASSTAASTESRRPSSSARSNPGPARARTGAA